MESSVPLIGIESGNLALDGALFYTNTGCPDIICLQKHGFISKPLPYKRKDLALIQTWKEQTKRKKGRGNCRLCVK